MAGLIVTACPRAVDTPRVNTSILEPLQPLEFTDHRLLVRPWRPDDAAAVHAACQDPEVRAWTRVPSPYHMRDAVAFVGEISARGWADGTAASFGVFNRMGDQLLGAVSLMDIRERDNEDAGGTAELGYWAAPWARGQGYLSDACRLLCAWGFAYLGLGRIEWRAMVGNEPSRRLADRLGFTQEGTLRQALVQRDKRWDVWVASLLPGELR